jgi:hypothetical protein
MVSRKGKEIMNMGKLNRTVEKIEEDIIVCSAQYQVAVTRLAKLTAEKIEKSRKDAQFIALLRRGR